MADRRTLSVDATKGGLYHGYDNSFALVFDSGQLAKGLRSSEKNPRNVGDATVLDGAVGVDGVLQILPTLTRLATTAITDGFPYPQIFVFKKAIIICGQTKIYEWISSALSLKLTVTAGSTWVAEDYHDFIYLSNRVVAVKRDPTTKLYTVDSDYPTANAILNFNGRTLIGAPDVS